MLVVDRHLRIPRAEFRFSFSRSGGPGGQNVNKVATKATLRWPVAQSESLPAGVKGRFLARFRKRITREGDLVLASQRYRDQSRNIDDCLERVRQMILSVAAAPRPRRATRPTRGSVERRLKAKKSRGAKKRRRGGAWEE
jgi:ribosome-associated protein